MKVFTDDLGSSLGKLVIDATVVFLISVQLAEIHWFNQTRASSQK